MCKCRHQAIARVKDTTNSDVYTAPRSGHIRRSRGATARALDELRNSLQNWSAAPGGPATNHSNTRKSGGFFSKISDMVSNPFRSDSRASPAGPCIPMHNNPFTAAASQTNASNPKPEPLHLLLCMKEGRFGTALYQEDIRELRCDRNLFRFLRHCYTIRRSALRSLLSLLSLRAPAAINFVMVNAP